MSVRFLKDRKPIHSNTSRSFYSSVAGELANLTGYIYLRNDRMKTFAKQRTLNFRFLNDPTLNLASRIVYSYLWKWARINFLSNTKPAKFTYKPVTNKRIIRATGFNLKTVRDTIQNLKQRGYLDKRLEPFQGHPAIMWSKDKKVALNRPLKWTGNKDIKRTIAKLFIETHPKKVSAGYFVKVLGISRSTCFRLIREKGVTVDTVGVTFDTDEGRRMTLKGVTVDTVGATDDTLNNSNTNNSVPNNNWVEYPNQNTTVRDADMTGRLSTELGKLGNLRLAVTADDPISMAMAELLGDDDVASVSGYPLASLPVDLSRV